MICPDCDGPLTATPKRLSCQACGFTEADPSMKEPKRPGWLHLVDYDRTGPHPGDIERWEKLYP